MPLNGRQAASLSEPLIHQTEMCVCFLDLTTLIQEPIHVSWRMPVISQERRERNQPHTLLLLLPSPNKCLQHWEMSGPGVCACVDFLLCSWGQAVLIQVSTIC